jgi:Zinc finger, C2H2 type
MTKCSATSFRLNSGVRRPRSPLDSYRCHHFASVPSPTSMTDYSTPPRTQSRATSSSDSSAPPTPSQGLGLLNCSFPSSINDVYGAASLNSCQYATNFGELPVTIPMCNNFNEGVPSVELYSPTTHILSSASLDGLTYYTTTPVSSTSSMPPSGATIGYSLAPEHAPVMLQRTFAQEGYHHIKQEEDAEAWFNQHIDLERSQSNFDHPSARPMKASSTSPSRLTNAALVSSPGYIPSPLSPVSIGQNLQFKESPTGRSESVESSEAFQTPIGGADSNSRRQNTGDEKRHVCQICNRAFDKKYNLREHEKRHDPSQKTQFVCPKQGCGKRLGRKTDVNRHVQTVHEKAKKFVCGKCSKRFDRKDTLARYVMEWVYSTTG